MISHANTITMTTYAYYDDSFNLLHEARNAQMRPASFWQSAVAPALATYPAHVRHHIITREVERGSSLMHWSAVQSRFTAFLNNPIKYPWNTVTRTHGVNRRYLSLAFLKLLEAHTNPTPYPLATYLTALIHGRIDDETLRALRATGNYPRTLNNGIPLQSRATLHPKRPPKLEPRFTYLETKQDILLSLITADLKAIQSCPEGHSRLKAWLASRGATTPALVGRPCLPGVEQYMRTHLVPRLPVHIVDQLRVEFAAFGATTYF